MKVEVTIENLQTETHRTDEKIFTIGKGSGSDIIIRSEEVSRKHLEVSIESGKIFITDLGSTNGSWIDEEIIVPGKKTEIHPFMSIRLGKSILLSFQMEEPPKEFKPKLEAKTLKKVPEKKKLFPEENLKVILIGTLVILSGSLVWLFTSEVEHDQPAVPILKSRSKVSSKKIPVVPQDDHIKVILNRQGCGSVKEALICDWLPGSRAVIDKNIIYVEIESRTYIDEAIKLSTNTELNWRLVSALFLLDGIRPEFDYTKVKNDNFIFILKGDLESVNRVALVTINAEALENLKVVLNRRRIEAVKEHGLKALKFTESYFQINELSPK